MIKNNNDKENRELYRQTFDEIHASEELLERIKSMKKKRTITKLARFGYAAAAAAAVFVASNGITYAATGESWTEKVIVYINGSPMEYDVQKDENGNSHLSVDLGDSEGVDISTGSDFSSAGIVIDDTEGDYSITITVDDTEEMTFDVNFEDMDTEEEDTEQ